MAGAKANLMVTDPLYNIVYKRSAGKIKEILCITVGADEISKFWLGMFSIDKEIFTTSYGVEGQ